MGQAGVENQMELRIEGDLESENRRLKEKVNKLIDLIRSKDEKDEPPKAGKVDSILQILHKTFLKIEEEKLEIPYLKNSKNSKDFLKVEAGDFARILADCSENLSEKNEKKIYGFMAACGIVKTQASGKIFWSETREGKSTKVLLVRKTAYRYFQQETEEMEV